jgi:SAM-dependent methyltransferase
VAIRLWTPQIQTGNGETFAYYPPSKQELHIKKLLAERQGIRLDIGGGGNPQPGFVNIDMRDLPEVDIVHDVTVYPWPLPDECVLVAIASHLVEHINPVNFGFIKFMDEVWRVMKPGGEFMIAAPHGMSPGYIQDPTHCNQVSEITWAYFDPLEPNTGGLLYDIYHPKPWRIKHLSWSPVANIEVVLVKRLEDYDEEE